MYYNPLGLNLNAGRLTNVFGNPPVHPMVRMGMTQAPERQATDDPGKSETARGAQPATANEVPANR